MATTQRRRSLTRQPDTRDLVADLVAAAEPTTTGEPATPPVTAAPLPTRAADARSAGPGRTTVPDTGETGEEAPAPAYRRGPGRPRNDRIMRPLTTTIEVGLRARVDEYAQEHNARFVDVLDQALRLALDVWEGKATITERDPREGGQTSDQRSR